VIDAEQPPVRTCPACGKEGRTRFERCPHCHSSYFATPRSVRRRRRTIAAVAGGMVVAALAALGIVVASDHSDSQAEQRAVNARRAAALRARITAYQAPHHGAAPELRPTAGATNAQQLAARAALVGVVEHRITRDAQGRVRRGEIDGPITAARCGTILKDPKAIPDDRVLSKHIGRYDCVAIERHVVDGRNVNVGELGYPFVAALNFDTYTYTWCRNTPAQGEAGVPLVFVRLDRACLAATGKALGTGYAVSTDPTH
jgi:hypothetical protein